MTDLKNRARTPRYELVAEDDGRVRLAEGTRFDGPVLEGQLRNISSTGALVQIRESHARLRFLDEGEMIKMEIAIPVRGRFAFFATVVRLEPSSEAGLWDLAVMFRNVPSALESMLDHAVTPLSADYSHPENFAVAAEMGSEPARTRVRLARWLARLESFAQRLKTKLRVR